MKQLHLENNLNHGQRQTKLDVTVMSFGYKQGQPPMANVVFDMRFLKNPYWVNELRPLTGLNQPVQKYVLEQPLAQVFLNSIIDLLGDVLPRMADLKIGQFVIAFGCTGGQHRSCTIAEALASSLRNKFPEYSIRTEHRELALNDGDLSGRTMGSL